LLHVEVVLHGAVRHVACKHEQRRAALGGLGDAGDGIGEAGTGMHAAQGQFAGRLGVGIGHAGGVAFVARRDQFDAGLDQRVRYPEIGGAEQAEAAARAVAGEIARNGRGDGGNGGHAI
jgi:hypothetical protein